ncbi:hypothetical protein ACN6MY_16480 [Peribacillus sp. B-H-3]|jgi:hypothetical protein|uniref:hypothetical protein n=1 Tax=Peribacillus sp. B-H-3 TaxID=3400420 RepID=UPI003B01CFE7
MNNWNNINNFEMISKALSSSYENIKVDQKNSLGLTKLIEAEKNMFQALTFHLQNDGKIED